MTPSCKSNQLKHQRQLSLDSQFHKNRRIGQFACELANPAKLANSANWLIRSYSSIGYGMRTHQIWSETSSIGLPKYKNLKLKKKEE